MARGERDSGRFTGWFSEWKTAERRARGESTNGLHYRSGAIRNGRSRGLEPDGTQQLEVPIGGRRPVAWYRRNRGRNNAADRRRAQIGGRSTELLHSGWTSPSTQRQTQDAVGIPRQKNGESADRGKVASRLPPEDRTPSIRRICRLRNRHAAAGDALPRRYFALPGLARDTISIILPSSSSGAWAFARA